jgi:hypothetical protein
VVASARVGWHAQLAHASKATYGVVQEAVVREHGEEGVKDGGKHTAAWPESECRVVEEVDERGGEVGPVAGTKEAGEEAAGVREEAGAGGEVGGEADVRRGGEGVGQEEVGRNVVEGAEEPEAIGDGSGGGGGGGEGREGSGGEGGAEENSVPASAEAYEVATWGEG